MRVVNGEAKMTEEVAYCPQCGQSLENYSHLEGGWCETCSLWFSADIVEDCMEEEE